MFRSLQASLYPILPCGNSVKRPVTSILRALNIDRRRNVFTHSVDLALKNPISPLSASSAAAMRSLLSFALIGLGILILLPSCNSRHYWKAMKAYDDARYQDATKSLQQAVIQWPNDSMAWRMLGQTQLFTADFEGAEKTFEELDHRAMASKQDRLNWATALMNQR